MSSLSTADYRELATEARNHVEDVQASAAAIISEQEAAARQRAERYVSDDVTRAQEQADRLDAVATIRELADAVEDGKVRGIAFAAIGNTELGTGYIAIDGDHAGLLGAVTALGARIDREQLAPV